MRQRRALVLTMLPILVAALLITASSTAHAAEPTTGTYQVFVQGKSFGTWVLSPNHRMSPYDVASWSIHKKVITVTSYGPPGSPESCLQEGYTFPCSSVVTFSGRKTSGGIASRSAPGLYAVTVNSTTVIQSTFYAVRTGGVRQASSQ
jgi:hypothetical protein